MKRHLNARIGELSAETHGRNEFHTWVLQQDEVWVDRWGGIHEIAKLDPEYALNILIYLYERGKVAAGTSSALTDALRNRILSPQEPDPARMAQTIAREVENAPTAALKGSMNNPWTWGSLTDTLSITNLLVECARHGRSVRIHTARGGWTTILPRKCALGSVYFYLDNEGRTGYRSVPLRNINRAQRI